ncbi:hypothetical protein GGTG_01199 [Gaeumannomyces tritici R3-111a-1]|uniref:Major facilitator superfamily (MFS) profile domain-containing protein n=1 Tax=Gaeumannomyces tritici (strain R3-111a-1) TaxID=644352 RepID=J3NIW5_GAET3|nr:hypothetical protein GGTG_01199 [Gaeumannomyces tritici R3-111a-1]EJT81215.1 hypothetical protein GGTG_01199 [Gaeumannomyces tritici R3-111a-1]
MADRKQKNLARFKYTTLHRPYLYRGQGPGVPAFSPLFMEALVAYPADVVIPGCILVFALPESPRWLFNHGREAEAVGVLRAVYDRAPEDGLIVAEKTAIIRAIELERSSLRTKSFFNILRHDDGRRVLLAWLAQFANQLGGINLVVCYIPSVLEINVGMSVQQSQILGGCINLMFPIGSLLPTLALDRMGRRKTMMAGLLAFGICMLLISALLSQAPQGEETGRGQAFNSASVAFLFLYMLFFGMSMNSVPNLRLEDIDHIFAKGGDPVKQARRIQARLAQGLPPLERDVEMGKAEAGGGRRDG